MLLTKDLKNATHNKYLCYKVFQLYHWQTKIKHVWDSTCNKNWLYSLKIYLYTNVRVPRINCISVLFNQTMKSIYIQTITSLQENFLISSAYIFDLQASLHIFNFLSLNEVFVIQLKFFSHILGYSESFTFHSCKWSVLSIV